MTDDLQRRLFAEAGDRALFAQAMEHALAYSKGVRERGAAPDAAARAGLAAFDEALPEGSSAAADTLRLLHEAGSPATAAQTGGRWFGFVNGGAIPAGQAASWLAAMWDQNCAFEVMSPVAARLEEVCEGWLAELLGLPRGTAAGFVSGSSMAIFCGLAAARWRLLARQGWDVNERGLMGAPPMRVVAGRQAHGAVLRALALLGLGTDLIEWVECDAQGRVRADLLPELDETTLLLLQAGEVNSGAFDDFSAIVPRARAAGAWVHADGAFGLWAAACARTRHLTAGMEGADSFSADAHKTLNAPYDSGLVLCADREALTSALRASGAYLQFGAGRDGMAYSPEMSRRGRVFELWAVLRSLGKAGVDALVGQLHERAVLAAAGLEREGFSVLNEVIFNQVLFVCADDAQTDATVAAAQAAGDIWLGGTAWRGRRAIRLSVCSWATTDDDITRAVAALALAREGAAA